jgi:hypothetical protein
MLISAIVRSDQLQDVVRLEEARPTLARLEVG